MRGQVDAAPLGGLDGALVGGIAYVKAVGAGGVDADAIGEAAPAHEVAEYGGCDRRPAYVPHAHEQNPNHLAEGKEITT